MKVLADPDRIYEETVMALAAQSRKVLDFGAGRGIHGIDLRNLCESVVGCDVDDAVKSNPFLHRYDIVSPGERLPYPDDYFDLIVSRYVLEHVEEPRAVAAELKRVLKPGGSLCAITPNKYGYVALAASAVPNSLHVAVLRLVQPERKPEDTFPTRYRMNTRGALEGLFGPLADFRRASGPSSYHFGSKVIARLFEGLHRILPPVLVPAHDLAALLEPP